MNGMAAPGALVALVTGATSGIGRAVAARLGADAMTVVVHGRDASRGAAAVREVEAAGGQARFVAADLGDADEVARLAADAGVVDVLVNNGGFSWFGPTPELDPATFDALFASNVRSAVRQQRAVGVPARRSAGAGHGGPGTRQHHQPGFDGRPRRSARRGRVRGHQGGAGCDDTSLGC